MFLGMKQEKVVPTLMIQEKNEEITVVIFIQMDYYKDLNFNPKWDFSSLKDDNDFLSDCVLHISQGGDEEEKIPAHISILANSSEFFYNTFTSNMIEATTGKVTIKDNPMNLFPRVVNWFYTGQINFDSNEIMSLIFIARNYGIYLLEKTLLIKLENLINQRTILDFVNQCFSQELPDELKMLEVHIAKYIDKVAMNNLSNALDVKTFAHALELTDFPNEKKVKLINEFLGDWECDEEEKSALSKCLQHNKDLPRLAKANKKWLPANFP